MDEVLQFLRDNAPFYIATDDGGTPKVRPFGFAMAHEGRLYLCMGDFKDVYRQLVANPRFELCATSADGMSWLRVRGRLAFDPDRTARERAFEVSPNLRSIYVGGADNEHFVVGYAEDAEATFCSMTAEPRTVAL